MLAARKSRAKQIAEERAEALTGTLDAVLAAHSGAVFELGADGGMRGLNEIARARLANDGTAALAEVAALATAPNAGGFDAYAVQIDERDGRVLLVERVATASGTWLAGRIAHVSRVWELSDRQKQVLERLVRGLSNKKIDGE